MSSSSSSTPPQAAIEHKLRDTFRSQPLSANPLLWQRLYDEAFHPWDRAGPSFALSDLLAQRTDLIPPSQERDSRGNPIRDSSGAVIRRRALIPGCGLGHDALQLSAMGYDVVGLDVSDTAVAKARENERKTSQEGLYEPAEEGLDKGHVKFLAGDFFTDDWISEASSSGKFDLIFDYTFLCALQLELRPKWAKRMSQLLALGGHLICLEFPIGKPLSEQGPPWGLWPEVYEALLAAPGEDVRYNDDGTVASDSCPAAPHPDALHRICLVKPTRTHKAGTNPDGKVRDFISVWCR